MLHYRRCKQTGLTMWSLSFLLLVLTFTALSVLRIMPFYNEYAGIVRSVNQVQTSGATGSIKTIKGKLLNKFYQNDVRSINDANFKQYITIKRTTAGKQLIISYTRQAPVPLAEMVFDNLYYATVFKKTYILK